MEQRKLDYPTYLELDRILDAQHPISSKAGAPAHDEMLFIVVHQVYELWFKLVIYELSSLIDLFGADFVDEYKLGTAVSRLHRIALIQKITTDQIKILETMTPLDFLDFRHLLDVASGAQSVQFRILENRLGLKPDRRMGYLANKPYTYHLPPELAAQVTRSEQEPSLFENVERWLERTPFLHFKDFDFVSEYRSAVARVQKSERQKIEKNPKLNVEEKEAALQLLLKAEAGFEALWSEETYNKARAEGKRQLSYKATLAALFINLYRDEPILHLPFKVLEGLVELDENLAMWRYQHALLVLRTIGRNYGTGGSSGYDYLRATVEKHRIFSDLFNVPAFLISRSDLGPLPPKVRAELGFAWGSVS